MSDKPLVIYHGFCPDGFSAAWSIWLLHPDWEFTQGFYQSKNLPSVDDRDVYMVDFSYKREKAEELIRRAKSVTILDHHQTADQELRELLDAGDLHGEIDMDRAGGVLTWDWFHPGEEAPKFIYDLQDYDLWQWQRKNTAYTHAAIGSYPFDFEIWSGYAKPEGYKRLVQEGRAIYRYKMKEIYASVDSGRHDIEIAGYTVPAVNLPPCWASEAGNILAETAPFSVVYFENGKGTKYSLRSNDRVDVSEIAKEFGGGGHANAAGFFIFND